MSLKIDRVSKSFDGRSPVLGDVSLSVEDGEFLALLGPSGSGKTTLLNIISGLTAPDSGRLVLNGEDITSVPAAAVSAWCSRATHCFAICRSPTISASGFASWIVPSAPPRLIAKPASRSF